MALETKDLNTVSSIIHEGNAEVLDETASKLGKELAGQKLTNSQIRNIFTTARQIEARWRSQKRAARRELILLKPKMAYQAARAKDQRNNPVAELRDWLVAAVDAVVSAGDVQQTEDERFRNFMQFFEAVLAYQYEEEVKRRGSKGAS
jgi:CRISPR type III-A-associated protein Csm2